MVKGQEIFFCGKSYEYSNVLHIDSQPVETG